MYYSRERLTLIVFLIAMNFYATVFRVAAHRYPWGLPAMLLLTPPLLRELDLRRGRPPRRPDSFEWSCFIGGLLFALFPLVFYGS